MTSVHGISVVGGTFPATIWHQFMSAALWKSPALEFPQPKHFPVYIGWHGQWAYAGGGYDSQNSSPAPASTATGTTTQSSHPGTTHLTPATTAPPPVTTEPVTTEPPPPATTEPPPPPAGPGTP